MNLPKQSYNKNILMISISFSPIIGGVETYLNDLCTYLTNRDHHVWVITYGPITAKMNVPAMEQKGNLTVYRIPWFSPRLFERLEQNPLFEVIYLFPALYFRTMFFLLFSGENIDVLLTHGIVSSLAGKFAKPFFRKRTVATVHTIYYLNRKPLLGRIFAWVLKSCNSVLFVSNKIRDEFASFGIESSKSIVFTYWADSARFKPMNKETAKEMFNWNEKFIVLFVGRLIKDKGADVLVKTARITDKRIYFAFITSGTYEEFRALVGYDLPANVIFVGPVDYSKLHLYYNAADIFVLPSQGREGFSRAVLEAALCGTPVVASNVGCLSEVVNSNIGKLVDPPTSECFRKIIEYYWVNRDELERLSVLCAKYAHEHFTENNAVIVEEGYLGEKSIALQPVKES